MTRKAPPVPPRNRSPKGPGDAKAGIAQADPRPQTLDPKKQGAQANIRQNTTHQGYQQDR